MSKDPSLAGARGVWREPASVPVSFGAADADEAGSDELSSPAFVVRVAGQVVVAGCRERPGRAAHMGVLTAPTWRGRGLARATGSSAVRHALAQGLLPQWRARRPESRKVALGFTELGSQTSVELVRPPGCVWARGWRGTGVRQCT
ncbi:GNAT family N-acetyltransferase [Kitasatospora purpeofusca]|uniref:GNAT family N-acetyltransferase n=1 Tax=Kitasatospora purpeofusca TaxID=67352 RepID=UPI0036E261B3